MTCSFPSLVSTDWLEQHLDDAELAILDVRVQVEQQDNGRLALSSGIEDYAKAHIPGAQHADMLSALSDTQSEMSFALPSERQFARTIGRLGVGKDSKVVVYSSDYTGWATRLWWLFKTFGHQRVAVLDGGISKWQREGRTLSQQPAPATEQDFIARLNPELVATRESVHAAVSAASESHCVIDSLPAAYFKGDAGDSYGYGRLGHITGAVNIPTDEMIDPASGAFLPLETLREKFSAVLNTPERKLITYCGGGIAATQNAFVLHLLGRSDVAVYDASLQEWTRDASLPMSLGES